MKTKILLGIMLLTGMSMSMLAQENWTQKSNFGGGERIGAFYFSIGSKGYVGTGSDNAGVIKSDFWEFDPATGVWTQKANYGGGIRAYATGFSVDGKGYAGTGFVASYNWRKDMWKYDPTTNAWSQIADFAGGLRYSSVAFSIGDMGYMGTGNYRTSPYVSATYLNDFWEYNPLTDIWTRKADVPEQGRHSAIGMSIGNKGYVGTGYYYYDTRKKDFWEYDPSSDAWTRKADFPGTQRVGAASFTIGNKGYVGTGWNYSGLNDMWEYNPVADRWVQRATFPGAVRNVSVAFGIGNKGYIGLGGNSTNTLNDFWEYTPPTCDSWTQLPNFPDIGRSGSVAVGIGDKGYMGLGSGLNGYYRDFWEFDPITKSWTQKSDFPGTERQAGVAFTVGEKAYVGTGLNMYTPYSDFYEYDPSLNSWTQKADYAGGRRYTAMAFSVGSKGYVGGGKDEGLFYGNTDFWEYDPSEDVWTRKADIGDVRRSLGVGFSVGDKGYIGLGVQNYDTRKRDLLEYDPANDTWTRKSDFPAIERYGASAFTLGNKAYVGTGYYYEPHNDMWEYDPASDKWTQKANVGTTGRGQGVGFSVGNKGYVGFGYNQENNLNDLWEYSSGAFINCPPNQILCYNESDMYTVPMLSASSNCGIISTTFAITGDTNRNGTGLDASGLFNVGTSMITWMVTDNDGNISTCQTSVVINAPLHVAIPNVYAVNPGGEPNTIYIGYGPKSLTLTANVTGGTPYPDNSYRYSWSDGSALPTTTVSPSSVGSYIYTVNVLDQYGCQATEEKTIVVKDVRCGNKLDKVLVCKVPKGNPNHQNSLCLNYYDVAGQLANGSYLGECQSAVYPPCENPLISIYPNPNNGTFIIQLKNLNSAMVQIQVSDRNGQVVANKKVAITSQEVSIPMDLAPLQKGIYIVKVFGDSRVLTQKMIVK